MQTLLYTSRLMLTATFLFILGFCSCSHNNNETAIIETLNESVVRSNKSLESQTADLYYVFDEKKQKIETHEKAKEWEPRLLKVKDLSDQTKTYIGNIRKAFIKEIGYKEEDGTLHSSHAKVRNFFIANHKAAELYQQLNKYRAEVLEIHPQFKTHLRAIIYTITKSLDEPEKHNEAFESFFFHNTNALSTIALLNKFYNMILAVENCVITYINENSTIILCDFTINEAIVGQSTTILGPGENIEIAAGVVAFSKSAKPEIFVRDRKVPLNDAGISIDKIKAPAQPGKYHIPVRIEFIDQGGQKQVRKFDVAYKVVSCLQSSNPDQ